MWVEPISTVRADLPYCMRATRISGEPGSIETFSSCTRMIVRSDLTRTTFTLAAASEVLFSPPRPVTSDWMGATM